MRFLLTVPLILLLGACSTSIFTPDPIGVGSGTEDLKASPCACVEIPMNIPAGAIVGMSG
jgi:hypothetical protein